MRIRALVIAVVAFALFFALGFHVARHGEPAILQGWEAALFDHSALLAWWLTWLCYIQVLVPIVVGLLIVAWFAPAWRARIFLSIITLLLCWRGADLFQHLFARGRPADWIVKHETAYSYPSSHAAIATGFYALWATMIFLSELPSRVRYLGGAALIVLAVAICWSRLALGAHYFTDLVGGALLGIALVSAVLAAVPVSLARPVAGRLGRAAE